jgi:hypothetical protein
MTTTAQHPAIIRFALWHQPPGRPWLKLLTAGGSECNRQMRAWQKLLSGRFQVAPVGEDMNDPRAVLRKLGIRKKTTVEV